jgi:hypothetical protein
MKASAINPEYAVCMNFRADEKETLNDKIRRMINYFNNGNSYISVIK